MTFIDSISSLKSYYAFNNNYKKPSLIGEIENQNLKAIDNNVEYVIVSHPNFVLAAEELAQIHLQVDDLNSVVVTPEQIYNEFSSGMQDVTAIRDFFRMLYKRPNSKHKLDYPSRRRRSKLSRNVDLVCKISFLEID